MTASTPRVKPIKIALCRAAADCKPIITPDYTPSQYQRREKKNQKGVGGGGDSERCVRITPTSRGTGTRVYYIYRYIISLD